MKTYKIPDINKQCVEKFQYVYPDSVIVGNIKFYHVYLGLYIGEDSEQKIENEELRGYGSLCIIEIIKRKDNEDERYSNLLFMYSENYSTWDKRTLENYLKYHKECFKIPEQLKNEVNKISKWLTITDSRNSEFSSLDDEERIAKFGFSCIRLVEVDTFYYREDYYEDIGEEFTSSDNLNNVVYHPTKCDFDVAFQFPVTDDYIVCCGKVGTKICSDVYEFFDNLEYREEYVKRREDVPWRPHWVERDDIYGLGKKIWEYGGGLGLIYKGDSIRYVTRNKKSEDFKHLKDKYNLIVISNYEIDMEEEEKTIKEKCSRTENDVIEEYKAKGCVEVFEGAGFVGEWEVEFKKIFDFKSSPKQICGKICMFSGSDILLFSNSLKKSVQLNKQLLRYLRIELNGIGHDFIKETDEKEIALVGENLVKNMRVEGDISYFD